jgi:hypothetical protein
VKTNVGWYFSGEQVAFPAMMAYGVTGNVKYKNTLIKTWSWLLGTNPLSRSFYSGLGDPQRSPRWVPHEIGHYQYMKHKSGVAGGWSEIPPGIPAADIQSGDYDSYMDSAWNVARKNKKYPAQVDHAPLYRYHDSWTVKNEFTIDRMSRSAASLAPLFTAAAAPVAQVVAIDEPMAVAAEEPTTAAMEDPSERVQLKAVEAVEDVATSEQALGVDPSVPHADPGSEEAISLASCRQSAGGGGRRGSMPALLSVLGLSALLVRSRRRRFPS